MLELKKEVGQKEDFELWSKSFKKERKYGRLLEWGSITYGICELVFGSKKIVVSVVLLFSVLIDQSYLIIFSSSHYENTCPHQCDQQSYSSIDFEVSAFKNVQNSLVRIIL